MHETFSTIICCHTFPPPSPLAIIKETSPSSEAQKRCFRRKHLFFFSYHLYLVCLEIRSPISLIFQQIPHQTTKKHLISPSQKYPQIGNFSQLFRHLPSRCDKKTTIPQKHGKKPDNSPLFPSVFVCRYRIVTVFGLYYNQPKSKNVCHIHSLNYKRRDRF